VRVSGFGFQRAGCVFRGGGLGGTRIVDFGFAWNFGTSGRGIEKQKRENASVRVILWVGDDILSSHLCLR
jgi:hypothetical protein